MKSEIEIDEKGFLKRLFLNDILVQLSGTVGVVFLYLLLEFYKPSFVIRLIFIGLIFVSILYLFQSLLIFRKIKKNSISSEVFHEGEIREIVKRIKFLYKLPSIFYLSTFFLWIFGGFIFAFVLRITFGETDLLKIVILSFSIIGLSPIAALASRIIAKRVIGAYISSILNAIDDELQLNFLLEKSSDFKWFFVNMTYLLFYMIFFYSLVSLSVMTNILKKNINFFVLKSMNEIKETIESFYFSSSAPEDLDVYLKTLALAKGMKVSFVDSKGKVFGYPLPTKINAQDIFIKSKVKDLGTLCFYIPINLFDYYKLILNRGLIFFIIFLLFLGYTLYFQAGKEIEIEFNVLRENIEKIANKDFRKIRPLYSDDEFVNLNLKIIEAKKNFSFLFSRFSHLLSELNIATNSLLTSFEWFSVLSSRQANNLVSTKSQLAFLNEFVSNITVLTSQLSRVAEDFSHVIVKFVAAINEARNETHNLLKITDGIATSITEINVSHNELTEQTERMLMIGERLMRSIDKVLEFIRNLSIENSESIKKLLTLEKQNNKMEHYLSSVETSMANFKKDFFSIIQLIDTESEEIVKLNQIFKIMEDLIDQTNVLALNASLVAAKTGTEESGFGVIAESIKDLSERLHVSMSDVSKIISRGINNFKVIKETSLSSKKVLTSIENNFEKMGSIIKDNDRQIKSISKGNDIIFVIIENAKMMLGELIDDMRTVENFLDSINFDFKEQKRTMDRVFDYSVDLKDIVEVIKVSYEQMSDSTSTFSFTYDKLRNLSGDLNESIGRFKNRLKDILELLENIDSGSKGINDAIIKMEFTIYSVNKTISALNSILSAVKIPSNNQLEDNE